MKKCPYCAEEIQDDAIICRFCGKDLTFKKNLRGGKEKVNRLGLSPSETKILIGACIALGLFLLILLCSTLFQSIIAATVRATQQAANTQQAAYAVATAVQRVYKTPTKVPTSTPTLKPTPILVVLYSDDFSDEQSGWYYSGMPEPSSIGWVVHTEVEGHNTRFFYSGGQYVISIAEGDNYLSYSCPKRTFTDAVLTVDTFLVSGSGNTGLVVIWRRVDYANFYGIYIRPEKGDFIFIKQFNDEWTTEWVSHYSASINKGNQLNKIAVSFDGGTFKMYINGDYVLSVQDTDIPSGDICLGSFGSETSRVEVSFDNLIVYTIESWTPPK